MNVISWRVMAAVTLVTLLFGAGLWHAGSYRFQNFYSDNYDTAYFNHACWQLAWRGSSYEYYQGINIFADHFMLTPWLLALLLRVWPSVFLLKNAQVLIIALGAPCLFLLARKITDSAQLAMYILLGYVLFPFQYTWIQRPFYPITMVGPLFFLFFLLADNKRWRWALVTLLLLLYLKENLFLLMAGYCLYWLVRRRRRLVRTTALGLLIYSVSWLAARVVMPEYGAVHHHSHYFFWYFIDYGESPLAALGNIIGHLPQYLLTFWNEGRFWFVIAFGAYYALVPFLRPGLLLPVAPVVAGLVFANGGGFYNPEMKYVVTFYYPLVLAYIYGWRRLTRTVKSQRVVAGLGTAIVIAQLLVAVTYFRGHRDQLVTHPNPQQQYYEEVMELTAADRSLLTSERLLPYFSFRSQPTRFINFYKPVTEHFILLDTTLLPTPDYDRADSFQLARVLNEIYGKLSSGEYRISYDCGTLLLLERTVGPAVGRPVPAAVTAKFERIIVNALVARGYLTPADYQNPRIYLNRNTIPENIFYRNGYGPVSEYYRETGIDVGSYSPAAGELFSRVELWLGQRLIQTITNPGNATILMRLPVAVEELAEGENELTVKLYQGERVVAAAACTVQKDTVAPEVAARRQGPGAGAVVYQARDNLPGLALYASHTPDFTNAICLQRNFNRLPEFNDRQYYCHYNAFYFRQHNFVPPRVISGELPEGYADPAADLYVQAEDYAGNRSAVVMVPGG